MADDFAKKGDGGLDRLDGELIEAPLHAANRLGARSLMNNELGDQ